MSFWGGFEKQAKKKEEGSADGRLAKHTGAALALSAVPGVLMPHAEKLDKKFTPEEAEHYFRKVRAEHGLNTAMRTVKEKADSGFYHPGEDHIQVNHSPLRGTIAHEMGHAQSLGRGFRSKSKLVRGYHKGSMRLQAHQGNAALLNPALAMSDNKTVQKVAPFVPLAVHAPTLIEEATASIKGLKDLKRHHGLGAAVRAAPGLAAGFGTYLAVPSAMGYITHRVTKYRQEKREEQRRRG